MDMTVFGAVRALHILVAALWLGAGTFLTIYLMPAVRRLGLGSDPLFTQLMQRRVGLFMAATSGITVITGLWLYWVFTDGLDAGVMSSDPGLALGIGGLAGLGAAVIGGAILGRTVDSMAECVHAASGLPPGRQQAAHLATLARLQRRFALFSRIDVTLMVVALLLMAMSHYV